MGDSGCAVLPRNPVSHGAVSCASDLYRLSALESALVAQYYPVMMNDLPDLLAGAFRDIRKRAAKTQEKFEEATGLSQGWISDVERGRGFDSLGKIGEGLSRAGIEPVELLRVALARAEGSPEDQELYSLLAVASQDQRRLVRETLKMIAPSPAGQVPARR